MYTSVDRDGVQRLVRQGARLVEVLPRSAYEQRHLPDAISLPLARLHAEASQLLRRDETIIVYCYDYQ